jgi:hypothetical protein
MGIILTLIVFFIGLINLIIGRGSKGLISVYFIGGIWFLPQLRVVFIGLFLKFSKIVFKYLDQGWIENIGAQGAIKYFIYQRVKIDT